jgi:hypothetical protein
MKYMTCSEKFDGRITVQLDVEDYQTYDEQQ